MGKGDHDPLPIVQLAKVAVRKEKNFKFWSNKDNDGEVDESWQVRFACMRVSSTFDVPLGSNTSRSCKSHPRLTGKECINLL